VIAYFQAVISYQNAHPAHFFLSIGGNGVTIITQLLELHEHIVRQTNCVPSLGYRVNCCLSTTGDKYKADIDGSKCENYKEGAE
jgi:hypothetical protein